MDGGCELRWRRPLGKFSGGSPRAGLKALNHRCGFFLRRAETAPTVELTQQSRQQTGASRRTQLPRGPCDIQLSSHGPGPFPVARFRRRGQESGGSGVFPDRTVIWAALGGTGGCGPQADGGAGVTRPPAPAPAARISEPLHSHPPHPAPLLCRVAGIQLPVMWLPPSPLGRWWAWPA